MFAHPPAATRYLLVALMLIGAGFTSSAARAELVLSQVIVDLQPEKPAHDDIEVLNSGDERMYVVAEPAEIASPGLPGEQRVSNPDPELLGLLVTPQRMVLEPGERKIIRISALKPRGTTERVYRVVIKPVAGAIAAETTAIKVLVGYDVLVLYRPDKIVGQLNGTRAGRSLTIRNDSNTAYELYDGSQCDPAGDHCRALGTNRLYPGATWEQTLPYETPVNYRATAGGRQGAVGF